MPLFHAFLFNTLFNIIKRCVLRVTFFVERLFSTFSFFLCVWQYVSCKQHTIWRNKKEWISNNILHSVLQIR